MKEVERPFILVAALRRTGSTLVSEALSHIPYCYILHEPYLAYGSFLLTNRDRTVFEGLGVPLGRYAVDWSDEPRKPLVGHFKSVIMPLLLEVVEQVGVKEIKLEGWETYLRCFPGLKVVLTGRDPRDIYISLLERVALGLGSWGKDVTPDLVARSLTADFRSQLKLQSRADCVLVRYEDLCTNPESLYRLREFVGCNRAVQGRIGDFLSNTPKRSDEHRVHGNQIGRARVLRWQNEPDDQLRRDAQRVFDLMPEYTEFWGYR